MQPILFTIGSFNVYAFGFFLFLSFLFSTFIVWKYSKEELKEEEYFDAFLYTNITALLSARIFYILFHFDQFGTNVLRFILVRETPGLSFLGGFLGGILFIYFWTKKKKLPLSHTLDLFAVATSFGLFLAKIGEQLGGGGFGRETTFFLGVKIVGQLGRHHPVELYESICFAILFICLILLYKKASRNIIPSGMLSIIFLTVSSLIIFLLEFLKVYPVYLYGLSVRHLLSLGMLVISSAFLTKYILQIVKVQKKK